MPYVIRDETGQPVGTVSSEYVEGAAAGCALIAIIPFILFGLAIFPALALFEPKLFNLSRNSAAFNHLGVLMIGVITIAVCVGFRRMFAGRREAARANGQPQQPLHWPRILLGLYWLVLALAWFRAYLVWLVS